MRKDIRHKIDGSKKKKNFKKSPNISLQGFGASAKAGDEHFRLNLFPQIAVISNLPLLSTSKLENQQCYNRLTGLEMCTDKI